MEQMPMYFQSIFEDFSLPQFLVCILIKIALFYLRDIFFTEDINFC